jgi:hypothetical protein
MGHDNQWNIYGKLSIIVLLLNKPHVAPPLPPVEVTALSSHDTRAAAEVIHRVTMRYKLLPKLLFLTSAYYTRLLTYDIRALVRVLIRFVQFCTLRGKCLI